MKINLKNTKGFTLVELIVSIGIISIMSAVSMAGFNDYGKKSKVDMAAYKLASDIRTAQNNALSLKDVGGTVPAGGWGLSFTRDETKYTFFADHLGNGSKNYFLDNTDIFSIPISLPDGVTISNLFGSGGDTNQNNGSRNRSAIVFEPPEPTGHITRHNSGFNTAKTLMITLTNGTYSRNVTVNIFGLVDVQ